MPLSDLKARKATPRDRPFKIADERGLFLLVTPAGSKLWRFKYRYNGKEKLLTFGEYRDVPLATARRKRDDARRRRSEAGQVCNDSS